MHRKPWQNTFSSIIYCNSENLHVQKHGDMMGKNERTCQRPRRQMQQALKIAYYSFS